MADTELGVFVAVLLLLRVGQAWLLCGTVRSKNAADAAIRAVLDLAVVALAIWTIAGLFGPAFRLSGRSNFLVFSQMFGNDGGRSLGMWMPAALVMTAAVLGATAERTRLAPLLVWSAIASGIALPLIWRTTLAIDPRFAAATDLKLAIATIGGGIAALIFAALVEPRKGKFNRDLSANFVPGHAVIFQLIGLLLTIGGFAAASRNGLHTLLGGCCGALAGAAFGRFRFGKLDAGLLIVSTIGGLCAGAIAAVPPGDAVRCWLGGGGAAAVISGALAGVIVPWALLRLEMVHRIDDVAGLSPAYVIGGTVGLLIHALTRHAPTVGDYSMLLAFDAGVWLASAIVIGGLALLIGKIFKSRGGLRFSETDEYDGIDLTELDINAYPDFQQTMIKSHHLRQL